MKKSVYRLFVERKEGFDNEAKRTLAELKGFVGIAALEGIRYFNRYDIEGIDDVTLERAAVQIFSEPQSDALFRETVPVAEDETLIAIEYLPGQYDQRADSAEQCLVLLRNAVAGDSGKPTVRCARVFALKGALSAGDLDRARSYLINPVDSRVSAPEKPESLALSTGEPEPVNAVRGFIALSDRELAEWHRGAGLAMDLADALFLRAHFQKEGRDPTETEIRVLDTYWSDHCRHTTFNTVLEDIEIPPRPSLPGRPADPYAETLKKALDAYSGLRAELYRGRTDKPVTLMDMAVIGAKALKKRGLLDDLEESAEINACSIFIDVNVRDDEGKTVGTEPWLLMFKNETHNHPTEIEPFGGAATCIGGAIRDPLSGRAWVYQALRVTGAADPTAPIEETIPGKLPQIKLTREAAAGFSAYGNQIGLTTGQVVEYYDPGFLAKRMELGAVIAAAPAKSVVREEPEPGDVVIMVGGGTGRDGIGGATGSSKVHTVESVSTAGAEVQKGNAVEERKIQRLFRNAETTRLIRRCNDFGAGGVAVAVGELAPGLDIDLDAVPKKYEGLNGTELAISESQERMAVVVRRRDIDAFVKAAGAENLNAAVIATVTAEPRLVMRWRGAKIVDIDRAFLDTAGASRSAKVTVALPDPAGWAWDAAADQPHKAGGGNADPNASEAGVADRLRATLSSLPVASRRGLTERFDGSIGSASVLFPMGGAWQSTPECGMAARIPVGPGKETSTVSLMSMGYDPKAAKWSPFHGAQFAVLESLAKILALGGDPAKARLTFQEYFERTADAEAWGKPAAALLGALQAQLASGCAAIGGKDSMSGTFHDLKVPPTLVSFAVAVAEDAAVRGGSLSAPGNTLALVHTPYLADSTPDWDAFRANAQTVLALGKSGAVKAAYPVGPGGIAAALALMAFGNRIGASIDPEALDRAPLPPVMGDDDGASLFAPRYGSLILELEGTPDKAFRSVRVPDTLVVLGMTTAKRELAFGFESAPLDSLQLAWEKPLARVFPPVSGALPAGEVPDWAKKPYVSGEKAPRAKQKAGAKPLVVLPVFPGTNCEYDMARAFRIAGADTRIVVIRNGNPEALSESLKELREAIDSAQILAFSGGFSAGDEPDGSAKFIVNVIRENRIADGVMELAETRKGLVLGICNGFQALIKAGLVPYGRIVPPSADLPTLTYNAVGRHVSRFVRTRMASNLSPWAAGPGLEPGKIHQIPVSHGEGCVIIGESLAREVFADGRVFAQYVDAAGIPVMTEPDNPNGSHYAIEALTDPTGRILGKMGHSERPIDTAGRSGKLYANIPGETSQNLFAAGVGYFS